MYDRIFFGVLFWEIDLHLFMNQTVIPYLVNREKYKFVQVIIPDPPISGEVGTEVLKYHFPYDLSLENVTTDARYINNVLEL